MASGLANLRRKPDDDQQQQLDERPSGDGYARRIAIQQLLNQVSPIFEAHAASGIPATALTEGVTLRDHVELSKRLAIAVASRLTNVLPENVDPLMVRTVRPAMAQFVADRGRAHIPVDIAKDTDVLVDAIEAVDPKYDINPFNKNSVSYESTIKMTASAAVSGILGELMLYDFRAGEDVHRVAARLVSALMAKTASVVLHSLGDDDNERSRVGLMQSYVKHHAGIMTKILERKGQETVAILNRLPQSQRAKWLQTHDPVGEAIETFKESASTLGGLVQAAEDSIKSPKPTATEGEAASPELT